MNKLQFNLRLCFSKWSLMKLRTSYSLYYTIRTTRFHLSDNPDSSSMCLCVLVCVKALMCLFVRVCFCKWSLAFLYFDIKPTTVSLTTDNGIYYCFCLTGSFKVPCEYIPWTKASSHYWLRWRQHGDPPVEFSHSFSTTPILLISLNIIC